MIHNKLGQILVFFLVGFFALQGVLAGQVEPLTRECLAQVLNASVSRATFAPRVGAENIKDIDSLYLPSGEINPEYPHLEELEEAWLELLAERDIKRMFRAQNDFMKEVLAAQNHSPGPVLYSYSRSRAGDLWDKLVTIRSAKYAVDGTYFIFSNDQAGQLYLTELKLALQRGADVHLQVNWALVTGLVSTALAESFSSLSKGVMELSLKEFLNAVVKPIRAMRDPYKTDIGGLKALRAWYDQNLESIGDARSPVTGKKIGRKARVKLMFFNPNQVRHYFGNLGRKAHNWGASIANVVRRPLGLEPVKTLSMNNLMDQQSHDKFIAADLNVVGRTRVHIGGSNVNSHYYTDYDDQGVLLFDLPDGHKLETGLDYFRKQNRWFGALTHVLGNDRVRRSKIALINGFADKFYAKMGWTPYREEILLMQELREQAAGRWFNEKMTAPLGPVGVDQFVQSHDGSSLYNKDGTPNLDFDADAYMDNRMKSPTAGIVDADITHNLQNVSATSSLEFLKRLFDRKARLARRALNQNSTLAQLDASLAHKPEHIQKIYIGKAYMKPDDVRIEKLRRLLADNPQIELHLVFNSLLTNDQVPTQMLFEQEVAPKLKSMSFVRDSKGNKVRVDDRIKIHLVGKSDDRRLTGNPEDPEYHLLHFKGILVQRDDGSYDGVGRFYDSSKDSRSVMETGTHNWDGRSNDVNSEFTTWLRPGTYHERFQHYPAGDPETDSLRYMESIIQKRSHLWDSDEYYAIRNGVMRDTQNAYFSRQHQSAVLLDDKSVHKWEESRGATLSIPAQRRVKGARRFYKWVILNFKTIF